MSALQQLANRVAANRYRQTERLMEMTGRAADLVEVVSYDLASGLATVRDASGGLRQVGGLELRAGSVVTLGGLFMG